MKILKAELKRILKSKSTLIMIGITFLLTVFLAYFPASSQGMNIVEPDGSLSGVSGIQAINRFHEIEKPIEGNLTSSKLLDTLNKYNQSYKKHNGDITFLVVAKELQPYETLMETLTYATPNMFDASKKSATLHDLTTQDAESFYERRASNQKTFLEQQAGLTGSALKDAQNREKQVPKPLYYASCLGWKDAFEYIEMAAKLLAFIVCIIASQSFANSYRSGEDDILRCTRFGRKQFAHAKVASVLIFTGGLYCICMLLFFIINGLTLGMAGLKTSVQFIDMLSPLPWTYGSLWLHTALYGLIAILATTSFVLFISSISKTPVFVMAFSIPLIILPVLMRFTFKVSGTVLPFIQDALPTSGLNVYYSFIGGAGGVRYYGSVWSPYVTVAAAVIEIIVFSFLASRAYTRHEAI